MRAEPPRPALVAALWGAPRPGFTARSFRAFCGLAAGLAGPVRRHRGRCCWGRGWPAPGRRTGHITFFARARRGGRRAGPGRRPAGGAAVSLAGRPAAGGRPVIRCSAAPAAGCTARAGSTTGRPPAAAGPGSAPASSPPRSWPPGRFCTRPVCLPVLARLVLPGTTASPAGRAPGRPGGRHQGCRPRWRWSPRWPARSPAAPSTCWPMPPSTAPRPGSCPPA